MIICMIITISIIVIIIIIIFMFMIMLGGVARESLRLRSVSII